MESLTDRLLASNPHSDAGCLRAYSPSDRVAERLGRDGWSKVVGWAMSDEDFYSKVLNFAPIMGAVVYTRRDSNEPLAFGLVIVENWYRRIACFHGGGWTNAWVNFDCARLLIDSMQTAGFSVRTSIATDNSRAIRFVRGLGMQAYRTVKGYRRFRLGD